MYFIIDLEATCWENRNVRDKNEIIEIGIVACNYEGEILNTYSSFVRPVFNTELSVFCRKLTNIEQEWIDNSNSLREVLADLLGRIEHDLSMSTNSIPWTAFGDWDKLCLQRDCDRHKIIAPFGTFVDLKELYGDYSGLRNIGLIEALRKEDVEFEGVPHRALTDAINSHHLARFLMTPEAVENSRLMAIQKAKEAAEAAAKALEDD